MHFMIPVKRLNAKQYEVYVMCIRVYLCIGCGTMINDRVRIAILLRSIYTVRIERPYLNSRYSWLLCNIIYPGCGVQWWIYACTRDPLHRQKKRTLTYCGQLTSTRWRVWGSLSFNHAGHRCLHSKRLLPVTVIARMVV